MRGDAWWAAIRPRLTPLAGERSRAEDAIEPLSADALETRLRELVAPYIEEDPASRVALSKEFRRYLARVESTRWYGRDFRLDFTLLSASDIASRFAHDLSLYGDDEGTRVRNAGVWVQLSFRGDHDASFVCCDWLEQARLESGDLVEPVAAGVLDWLEVHELHEVVSGEVAGRQSEGDVVVFKSNGIAAWDVALGAEALRRARDAGVGTRLPLSG